jgi:hypothetical protein
LAPDFPPSINTSIQQTNRLYTSSAAVHPLLAAHWPQAKKLTNQIT